jgi:hypothetical protein
MLRTDNIPLNEKTLYQYELGGCLKTIENQIRNIKIALEEERAGETNRINGTLKVIVNGLITRLEGLGSDHLVELISFLRQEYL